MKRRIPAPDISIWTALCIIILCLAAAAYTYRYMYKATPDYSLSRIITAAQSGDASAFEEMTDGTAISGQLFDAMIQDTDTAEQPSFLLQLAWRPLKTQFTANTQTYLHCRITGDIDTPSFKKTEQDMDNRLRTFGIPIPMKGWHYVSSSFSRRIDDNTAEIDITFHQDLLNKNITGTVIMTRYDKNDWHVTGITHADTFLKSLHSAYESELAAYNQPVRDKINRLVTLSRLSSQLVRSKDNKQTFLRLQYTPIIKGNPERIKDIQATYTLQRSDDNTLLYYADVSIYPDSAETVRTSQFLLNPLIPSQYTLIGYTDLSATTASLSVTAIHFKDGTTWKLANALPET